MKSIRHVLGIVFIILLLCTTYYIFFSGEKYSGQAQYVPSLIFSILVVLCLILSFLYTKKIMKFKWPLSVFVAILSVFLLFVSSNFIHDKYGFLLQHYYHKTAHTTLLGLPSFANESNNYFAVKRIAEENNRKLTSINDGWNGEGDFDSLQVYYINDSEYIVIDWETETMVQNLSQNKLEEIFLNQMNFDHIDWITHNGKNLYVVQNGNATNYVIIPTMNSFHFSTLKDYQKK